VYNGQTGSSKIQHNDLANFISEIERQFLLPQAVRRRLFAWQKKFGEIDSSA